MISLVQYYGMYGRSKDLTPARQANAQRLLKAVNRLMALGMQQGIVFMNSPATRNQISTDVGGFRSQSCKSGAPFSAHKEALAIDLYDGIEGAIGKWLMEGWKDKSSEAHKLIEELGLYFEHPDDTVGQISHWSHWSLVRPASGNRFFHP